MKIIRITNPRATNYKMIEWQLHNVCNYDCSFCNSVSKGGDRRWLDLEVYLGVIDRFIDTANEEGKIIYFMFTGGEPTLMPDFIEIPRHIKKRGHRVNLITNGSRTLRWWSELAEANCIDNLWLSMHSEQGMDPSHIVAITELFSSLPTNVITIVTAPPTNFDNSYASHLYIVENGVCISSFRYIYEPGKNLLGYTPEQLEILQKNTGMRSKRFHKEKTHGWIDFPWDSINIEYSDGTTEVGHATKYVSRGEGNFFGWKCSAGVDFIRIEHTDIYRGTCKQGGVIGNILEEDFGFSKKDIICTSHRCNCVADFNQPKFKL